MADDDVRTLVRDFRASVSADLADNHRRMNELVKEVRQRDTELSQRITTAETAILNTIGDESRETARRFREVEGRLASIETTLEGRLASIETTLEGRLASIETTLEGILGKLGESG